MPYLMSTIINFLKIGILIFSCQFLLSSGCNKDDTKPCWSGGYSFSITSEWMPQKEIYNIADTITLLSTFSKTLTDQINTSLIIDYSNSVGIGGGITIYKLDTILHQPQDAAYEFEYFTVKGSISDSETKPLRIKNILYKELSSEYSLHIRLRPKEKGIYAIYISNLGSQGLLGQNCTNAEFNNILTNTNKNLSLFEYAMGRPPASQYEIDRLYCFRVQ